VLLLVALIGCVLVAGGMILYKRWRDGSAPPPEAPPHTHIRLGI
jgi:hypothetical protein